MKNDRNALRQIGRRSKVDEWRTLHETSNHGMMGEVSFLGVHKVHIRPNRSGARKRRVYAY